MNEKKHNKRSCKTCRQYRSTRGFYIISDGATGEVTGHAIVKGRSLRVIETRERFQRM